MLVVFQQKDFIKRWDAGKNKILCPRGLKMGKKNRTKAKIIVAVIAAVIAAGGFVMNDKLKTGDKS